MSSKESIKSTSPPSQQQQPQCQQPSSHRSVQYSQHSHHSHPNNSGIRIPISSPSTSSPPPPPPQQHPSVEGSSSDALRGAGTRRPSAVTSSTLMAESDALPSPPSPPTTSAGVTSTFTRLPSVAAVMAKLSSRLRQLSPAGSVPSYFSILSPPDSKEPSPTYSPMTLQRRSQSIKDVEAAIRKEDDSLDSFSPSPRRVLSRPLEPRRSAPNEAEAEAAVAVGMTVDDGRVANAWEAVTTLPESVTSSPEGHVAARGTYERRVMSPSASVPVSNAEVLANFIPVLDCLSPAVGVCAAAPANAVTSSVAGPPPLGTFSAPHLAVSAHDDLEMSRVQTPVPPSSPTPNSLVGGSASSSGAEGGAGVLVTGGVVPEEYLSRRSSQEVCCRICQETEAPLHVWCECKGTIGMAHKACLEEWLARSGATRCELCGFEYHTRRERRHTSRLRSVRFWLRGNVMEQTALLADAVGAALCLAVGSGTAIVCGLGMASLRRGYRGVDLSSDPDALFLQLMCVVASMVAVVWFVLAVRFHVRVWRRWWSTQYDIRVVPRSEESIQNSEARRALRRSKDSHSLPIITATGGGATGTGGISITPRSTSFPMSPHHPVSPHPPTPSPRRSPLRRVAIPRRHGDAGWWARFWRGLTGNGGGVRPPVRRQGEATNRRLDEIADSDLRAALSRWQARGRRFGLGFRREPVVSAGSSGAGGSHRVANMRIPRPTMERININRMYSPSRPRAQFFPMMDPLDAIWSRGGFAGYPMLSMPSSFVHQYGRRPRIAVPSPPFGALGLAGSSNPVIPGGSYATASPWTSPSGVVTPSGVSVPRSASASTDRLWRL